MVWLARRLCISPEGRAFSPGARSFYRHVGYDSPDFDLADYAVRNMGYVSLGLLGSSMARLRCRPQLLTAATIRKACRELREKDVDAVQMSCVEDGTAPGDWSNYR